jgi:hypothetical protein
LAALKKEEFEVACDPGYAGLNSIFVNTVAWSLTGASESRIGESSSSVLSLRGVHLDWSQPIGMNTYPRRRTPLAAVLEVAVAAGTIASSSGNASDAPTPLRKVLRGIYFLVMNFIVLTLYFERLAK